MKKSTVIISLLLTLLLAAGVSAETLTPALDIIASDGGITVSGISGETVTFEKENFSDAAGERGFDSITVASLPDKAAGTLYLSDSAVSAGQRIPEGSIPSLRFEPKDGAEKASFDFTFDKSYTLTCSIVFTDRQNSAPTVIENQSIQTFRGTDFTGCMRGFDPDGDKISFELEGYPERGSISLDADTGDFCYTPSSKLGEDSFSYRAVDEYGDKSDICTVSIDVLRNTSSLAFSDMDKSGAVAAAVTMCDSGLMTYSEDDGKQFFSPESSVSRLDFLVTAMNVFGASKIPQIENTGFSDDEDIPAEYKGYVYSAAKLGIISGSRVDGKSCFLPDKTITRAEASVILNNIIGHTSKCSVNCSDTVPEWANDAVSAMYELGIFDLDGGEAKATSALVKEDAAQMLFNLSCLLGE